ncbi:ABC transporter permease [Chloroflexota bacterium]
MARFVTRRIGLIIITLLVVSLAIFVITEVLPGDVATMILGQDATEEGLEKLREDLGLNRPAHERYLDWIGDVLRGDLGYSYAMKLPITDIVGRRLWHSAILAVFAFLVGVPAAVTVGIWAGVHPNTKLDRLVSMTGLVGISIPEFVTGLLLMLLFSSTLHILPSSSIILPGINPLTSPQILIMPTLTITAVLFAYIMRMTRANVIEVMQLDYVRTAILKGLPMRQVILRHVLPNAMLPTITIIASSFGWLLGGIIIVESVFAYPGIGQLLLRSIETHDIPLLEVVALLVAGTYAISNLVADLSYAALDPRVRLA